MVKFVRSKIQGVGITVGVILVAIFIAQRFGLGEKIIGGFKGAGSTAGESVTGIFSGFLEGLISGGQGLGESAASLSEGFQRSVSSTLFGKDLLFSETTGFGGTGEIGGTFIKGDPLEGFSLAKLLNTIERNPQEIVSGIDRRDVTTGGVFISLTELFTQAGITKDPSSTGKQPSGGVFDLTKIIKEFSITNRIEQAKASAAGETSAGGTAFGGFESATEQEAGLQATLAKNALLFPDFFK